MKITAKTLKGQLIPIEIDGQATVLNLKEQIKAQKDIDVDAQKIVFKGKAVNNNDVLSALGVKEGDFLVVMTLIKKPQPKKQQPKVEQKKQQQPKPQQKKQQSANNNNQEKKTQSNNNVDQQQIAGLMAMGFQRQQCIKALKAAFNNSDRAVQYLLNGIPNVPQPRPQSQGGQQGSGQQQVQNMFRILMANPMFGQLRQIIRANPAALQPLLQQLATASPQIYTLITQHPQAFQRVIMQDGPAGSQAPPPGSIQVSPQQAEAINRLMALGFNKMDAAQAYFACDKNQQLAANLLFDRQANGDLQPLDDVHDEQNNDGDDDNLF